jgi:small multidrug resistance family-3 protein
MATVLAFIGAAVLELSGYFAFWAWLRLGKSAWWLVPGAGALLLFGFLLTLADVQAAGRAFAAYGGIYIAASLAWLWFVEGMRPDGWDMTGAAASLLGAATVGPEIDLPHGQYCGHQVLTNRLAADPAARCSIRGVQIKSPHLSVETE